MKIRKIFVIMLIQVLALLALTGCGDETVIKRLDNYGIDTSLLKEYRIVCDIKGDTFTGQASRYSVIDFDEKPTEFINSFNQKDSDGFSSDDNNELKTIIDTHSGVDVPKDCCPNWENEYLWWHLGKYTDALYLVYFPNNNRLIVYETGH